MSNRKNIEKKLWRLGALYQHLSQKSGIFRKVLVPIRIKHWDQQPVSSIRKPCDDRCSLSKHHYMNLMHSFLLEKND